MKRFNFAYAAGYIDGDGCIYLGKTVQKPKDIIVYEYSIQVVSVKKESIKFLKNCFGGYIRVKPTFENHRTQFLWTIKSTQVLSFAKQIYPLLTDKQKSCKLFINFVTSITPNNFKKVSKEILIYRNNLIKEIRKEKHMNDWVTKEKIESIKNLRKTIKPSEEDFAYLAGLIDAEGCFRISSHKPKDKPNRVYSTTLEIGNKRFPIFPWLIKRFGGNISFHHPKNVIKPGAIWSISSKALSNFIQKIHPFLRIKKEVAQKIIEFYATTLPNGGDRHSENFKKSYSETLKVREIIVAEIHKLNLKGIKK